MTPFMLSVRDVLDGGPATSPATEASAPTAVAVATDTQVVIRSLAEQLVSEANAILREHGPADEQLIGLDDDCTPGQLGFTLSYRDRAATVQTTVSGHSAIVRFVESAGPADARPRRLQSEDEVRSLVLALLYPR